mgnify:CR=1 FL=1
MIRSTGPLYVFILSALAPILYPIKIQPLLVGEVTSTGNYMLPVLLRTATSIGHFADQYWLEKRPI